ncbi:barstar family protein [Microbacterium sp. NPDC076768]|uniref:barstar family protein n=1 Tax=Microbacterium sp. NPDC076768 TaxID=3154858 RepID=UPI003435C639
MRTTLSYLWTTSPPWISVGHGEPGSAKRIPSYFYNPSDSSDVCVRKLRGWKMRSYEGLMDEFGAVFQFFDGFGENWPALGELLQIMDDWLPAKAYVLVIERAEEVLADDPVELPTFLKVLNYVGDAWAEAVDGPEQHVRPPIPFHALMIISENGTDNISRFTAAAAERQVPLRLES